MLSIYKDLYSVLEGTDIINPTIKMQFNPGLRVTKILQLTQFVLKNAKLTTQAIEKKMLNSFDPIVGDDSCQNRGKAAINAILDSEFVHEAKKLNEKLEIALKKVNQLLSKIPDFGTEESVDEIFKKLELSFEISEKMTFLCRAHLLTLGKILKINRDGKVTFGVDVNNLIHKLKGKPDEEIAKKIVHRAREQISLQSTAFIQKDAEQLQTPQAQHIQKQLSPAMCKHIKPTIGKSEFQFEVSCAFYNFQAILLRCCEQQIPILLKERVEEKKQVPIGLYYRSETPGALPSLIEDPTPLHKDQPVFVIECFFPRDFTKKTLKEAVDEKGLLELALANVAVVPQFSSDDDITLLDETAQNEIKKYRELGKSLGCGTPNPNVFNIVHTHSATVKEEKVQ